jgi:2-polyprenyl-3-methyl-5-hydroxy-6-metoxy-1,4-benzoquinol methylase
MRDYYDRYWRDEARAPLADPLAATRIRLLDDAAAGIAIGAALDVGCGRGDVVGHLAARGADVTGMEVAPAALALARDAHPGCRFFEHDVEELPWPVEEGVHDLVVSFEVVEHLLEPQALFAGASAALRPGGHLALTTPYHGLLKNMVIAAVAFDRHFDVNGDHIRFFSDAALRRTAEAHGFAVERVAHFGRRAPLWAGTFVWARRM